ncbi:tail fiber assembly protein [Salmonella enterica]|nr:tail fiber assembly protein [Salmonella enterica]
MSGYFYSKKYNGFFFDGLKKSYQLSEGWPDDAVPVEQEKYDSLLLEQARGATISSDDNGNPIVIPKPEPTPDEIISSNKDRKSSMMNEANQIIGILQDAETLGISTLTEKEQLNEWRIHRINLNRVDTSDVNAVFPERPLLPE